MFGALGRPRPDDDPVALGEGPLEEPGEGAFERGRQQMVKADFRQGDAFYAFS